MNNDEITNSKKGIDPNWQLREQKLYRDFKFKDFGEAMSFVNQVAGAADEANHHPDISISYNRVTLELSTHDVGGLSKKDFKLAAKIDKLHGSKNN